MGRRALLVALWLPYVLSIVPLLAFSLLTWIITGNNLDAQLDWYLDVGERFYAWAVGDKGRDYDWV